MSENGPAGHGKDFIEMSAVLSKLLAESERRFDSEIGQIIEMSNSLNCWSNLLQSSGLAGLVSEIFVDVYMSIHFSLSTLYKYADMALRSGLETSLNVAYFYSHPVELGWWQAGSGWYRERKAAHAWGDGYNYFQMLAGDITEAKTYPPLEAQLKDLYHELSKSIHSTSQGLQTGGGKLAPRLDVGRFKDWSNRIRRTLSLINIVFLIALRERLVDMRQPDKDLVKSSIIGEHSSLAKSLGL